MKHSYGVSLGLHFRQPEYTRGQLLREWLLSCQFGQLMPFPALHRLGGHEKRGAWARITVLGVSLQINFDHSISNWSSRKPKG
jgi:hypothetical protein